MTVIEVRADGATLYTCRETGEVLRIVYTDGAFNGRYDHITGFNPTHPALMFAQEWDEVSMCSLGQERVAV